MAKLTDEECDVLALTAQVWNGFLALPRDHPDEITEFRQAIHRVQDSIFARVGRRAQQQPD